LALYLLVVFGRIAQVSEVKFFLRALRNQYIALYIYAQLIISG